jgi:GH24 family phage-related lysozyme (muramidase)
MKTSQTQIKALMARERFSPTAYKDGERNGVQLYSIGYGHQIQPAEQALKRQTITKDKGMQLFQADLKPLEIQLSTVKYPLNQNQFDGLVSFGYNCGSAALSKCISIWNTTKRIDLVQQKMNEYIHTTKNDVKVVLPELENRRAFEIAFMNKPVAVPVLAILAASAAFYFLS